MRTRTAIVAAAIGLGMAAGSAAAAECGNLPRSGLKVGRFEASGFMQVEASAAELDRLARESPSAAAYRAPHPLMLLIRHVRSGFRVNHRPVTAHDGDVSAYCDAPKSVGIGLGFVLRLAYLAPEAAADACVRQALIEHEGRHERAEIKALKAFLRDEADGFAERLRQLKQTPAPSAAEAERRFEAGIAEITSDAERRFLAIRDQTREAVDSPEEIERLQKACGGRLRRLEQGPL